MHRFSVVPGTAFISLRSLTIASGIAVDIKYQKYNGCLVDFLPCSFNSKLLNFIGRVPQTCCINQPEMNAPDADHIFDGIPCRPLNLRNDGPVFT